VGIKEREAEVVLMVEEEETERVGVLEMQVVEEGQE
jgi:hypothetical protein